MIAALKAWLERRRVRRALLAQPGVDRLLRRVMDGRYGKHNWRINDGVLEVKVSDPGRRLWWGAIGFVQAPETRDWLEQVKRGQL